MGKAQKSGGIGSKSLRRAELQREHKFPASTCLYQPSAPGRNMKRKAWLTLLQQSLGAGSLAEKAE